MSPEKIEIISGWYRKAEQDIMAADVITEANPMLYDVAAFHAQQCAEKYLKAFITFNEVFPPKTHDIRQLLDLAASFDESFIQISAAESLSKYSVRSRYPDDFEIADRKQIEDILSLAKQVKDFVRNKIGL